MTQQGPEGPRTLALPTWAVVLLVVVPVLMLAAIIGAALLSHPAGFDAPGGATTETRLKEPGSGLILVKRVASFKGAPDRDRITLAIRGQRSAEEPFALYQHEVSAKFQWDHGTLDACVDGDGRADRGAYWNDHVVLPDGGTVGIVKTCPGPRIDATGP